MLHSMDGLTVASPKVSVRGYPTDRDCGNSDVDATGPQLSASTDDSSDVSVRVMILAGRSRCPGWSLEARCREGGCRQHLTRGSASIVRGRHSWAET